jgi:hypothetical protein
MSESLYKKLKRMCDSKEAGLLMKDITVLANFILEYHKHFNEDISHDQALEELKKARLIYSFGMCRSALEKQISKEMKVHYSRNVLLDRVAQGARFNPRLPTHYSYEGSWEVLEEEMSRDAEILIELGFNIDYRGHNAAMDVNIEDTINPEEINSD